MVKARKIRIPLLFVHGVFMLSLGMVLSLLGNSMTNPGVQAFGSLLAVLLVSGCLPVAAWISYREGIWTIESVHAVRIYLLAGTLSVAFGAIFWMSQLANAEMHALPILTGFYGMYWGMWNFGLALELPNHSRKQTVLCIFGGMAAALGLILATQFQFSDLDAITALSCYVLVIGMQGLGIVLYLFRDLDHRKTTEPSPQEQMRSMT